MNRTKRERELRDSFPRYVGILHRARGGLRKMRPHVLTRDTDQQRDALVASNPALDHMLRNPVEHRRVTSEILADVRNRRQSAAGIALYPLPEVSRCVSEWRAWVQETRRDVSVSLPDALNGITPDGTVLLSLLRVQLMPSVATMSAAQLLTMYQAAFRRRDPRATLEMELIEQRLADGGVATTDDDRQAAKTLRDYVDGVQGLRVPIDLPDFEALDEEASRLQERARVLGISPINPDHQPTAAALYRELEAELLDAGRASDRDDLAAVHEELAAR